METLQKLKNWFVSLFRYNQQNSDLSEELEFHIDMLAERNVAAGMSAKQARSAALKQFGGRDKLREQCLDSWRMRKVTDQIRNLKLGFRLSTRYLSSSILAVIVLGAGIAISIMMYTLSTKFLDSSSGGKISEHHFLLYWDTVNKHGYSIPIQDYKVIREELESLEELVAMEETRAWFNLPGNREDNKQYRGLFATSNFFDLTDTAPLHGRLFSRIADGSHSSREIVISHALWSDFFNGDESAIGSSVIVGDEEYAVVGVMPIGFAFPKNQQFWVSTDWQEFDGATPIKTPKVRIVGKLGHGLKIEQSLAELDTLSATLSGGSSESGEEKWVIRLTPYKYTFAGENVRVPLVILFGGAFLALMLACTNVFHIIIARTAKRSHELAVRCSLGAKRGHIMWQVIVDGLTLASLGAMLGLALAALGLHHLSAYLESFTSTPGLNTFHLKPSTLLFSVGAALVAGIAASVLPAWRASKIDAFAILKDDSKSSSSIFVGWLSRAIVISQVAFSAVLIFLSYFFLVVIPNHYWSSSTKLLFDENSLLTAGLALPYKTVKETLEFYASVKQKLNETLGVRATALSSDLAGLFGDERAFEFELQESEPSYSNHKVQLTAVTPDYLEAYGLNLISGRFFTVLDTSESAPVCVVNSQFVENYCNNLDPIGLRLKIDGMKGSKESAWIEIIGVVPSHRPELPTAPTESIILPYTQELHYGKNRPTIVINAEDADNPRYRQAIRLAVRELAPQAVFSDGVLTVKERFDIILEIANTLSIAGRFIGGSILLMSMVGLYSIISFTTTQRRKEFGIRIAIGSNRWGIAKTVLKPWFTMICVGLIIGFVGAKSLPAVFMAYMAKIKAPTFALEAFDNIAVPYFWVSMVICLSSLIATAIPAWRATKVDPMKIIRIE